MEPVINDQPPAKHGKTVILVRHAKSSWANFSLPDFERPLNERGKHDAPMMAKRLLQRGVRIDAFITSPAKRAKRTAQAFADAYGRSGDEIIYHDELYLAEIPAFQSIISQVDDRFSQVAIFSHNGGITDYANTLSNARIDEMPTCGIFAVHADCEHWHEFQGAVKEFWFADYPKSEE